jgi:lipopolysaccharide/colanic/teichoic acid biosynthesis glycosyltransferase
MHTLQTTNTFPTFKYYSVSDNPLEAVRDGERSYLYIGQNETEFVSFKTDFKAGISLENLEKGIQFLNQGESQQRISVIFIDLPFCYTSLHVFLSEKEKISGLANVPVILNIRNFTPEEISFVRKKKMADELVDFKVEMASIQEKIEFLRQLSLSISDNQSTIKIENKPSAVYPDTFFLKRTLDIMLSLILMIVLAPLFVLIALAIKLESRGPVFYNSYRAGRGFKIFKLYHFRTMKVGADRMLNSFVKLNKFNNFGHAPVIIAPENDPRFTKLGRFLSKSGLNKLPGLINVLDGNLSFVGKDPLHLYEAASFTKNDSAGRFVMHSGLSGMWKFSLKRSAASSTSTNSMTGIPDQKKSNVFTEYITKMPAPAGSH